MEKQSTKQKTETYSFQAETKQLLDLMIHSIYSNKEIFLRELISNASDALDKIRFEALTNKKMAEVAKENPEIRIDVDKKKHILTVHDNGIGMTHDEVVQNIGTIAKSGTKELLNKLSKKKDSKVNPDELIGQFGVGFYSAFMVADKITLVTKKAGTNKAVQWVSEGDGTYTLGEVDKDQHGTSISLHLKKVDKENNNSSDLTEFWTVQTIIKKYSNYIRYNIVMKEEHEEKPLDKDGKPIEGAKPIKIEEDKVINESKPIWLRSKSSVKPEEYKEFYKHISHDWQDPTDNILIKVEGKLEYTALLFIPSKAPMDLYYPTYKAGLQLYTKRVMIMESCEELLPKYLRFISGVVDSSDLPLNISREILQDNPHLIQIKKRLTKKVLDYFSNLLIKDREKYLELWGQFGIALKEGVSIDYENKEKLEDIFIYRSSNDPSKYTTLAEYVSRMPKEQTEIYYLSGESLESVKNSPHLEIFQDKNYEVLFFIDPIDEFITQFMSEFKGKKLKSISKGDVTFDDDGKEEQKKKTDTETKEYKDLLEVLKQNLNQKVKEVRVSTRLVTSPVCLVGDTNDMSPHIEKLLSSMNQDVPGMKTSQRILEVNPNHPILQSMKKVFQQDKENPILKDYSELLYGYAILAEGAEFQDATRFNEALAQLMLKGV